MFGGASFEDLEALLDERENYASPHVEVDFAKMWLDGAPTPPYFTEAGFDEETGRIKLDNLLVPEDELNAIVTRLDKLGIKAKMLGRWKREAETRSNGAFTGNGQVSPESDDLRRLREENKRLRMERESLKKTVIFFASQSS